MTQLEIYLLIGLIYMTCLFLLGLSPMIRRLIKFMFNQDVAASLILLMISTVFAPLMLIVVIFISIANYDTP